MWRSAARRSAQIRRLLSSSAPSAGTGAAVPGPCIVHKRGNDILHDPWYNKDTAFPLTERDRLGPRGLLPPRVMSFEQQYEHFRFGDLALSMQAFKFLDERWSLKFTVIVAQKNHHTKFFQTGSPDNVSEEHNGHISSCSKLLRPANLLPSSNLIYAESSGGMSLVFRRWATKKTAGSTKNGRGSNPKYLGVKKFGGEKVELGNYHCSPKRDALPSWELCWHGEGSHSLLPEGRPCAV